MKDRLLITISDVSGSRHYNVHQFVKRAAAYCVGAIILLTLIACLAISHFRWSWHQAEQKYQQLTQQANNDYLKLKQQADEDYLKLQHQADEDYQKLKLRNELLRSENNELALELGDQNLFIEAVTNRIEDIEELAQSDTSIDNNADLLKRIELAGMTIAQKKLMLKLIPNGKAIIDYRRISSPFGTRTHPVTGKKHTHTGIDYSANRGTPIYATADGVIEFVRGKYSKGYGSLVKIQHSLGFETLYAHLDKTLVKVGQYVPKGTKIGLSGNTGVSTGPHLHYEVRFVGRAINPKPFTSWSLTHFDDLFNQEKSVPWQSFQNHINQQMQLSSIPPLPMDAG